MTFLCSRDLQSLLKIAEAAIRHGSGVDDRRVQAAAERIFTALQTPSTQAGRSGTGRLAISPHLPTQPHAGIPLSTLKSARMPTFSWSNDEDKGQMRLILLI